MFLVAVLAVVHGAEERPQSFLVHIDLEMGHNCLYLQSQRNLKALASAGSGIHVENLHRHPRVFITSNNKINL